MRRADSIALCALTLASTGCASSRVVTDRRPPSPPLAEVVFRCQGARPPPPQPVMRTHAVGAERLTVVALPSSSDGPRVRVVASDASVGALGLAVGEALRRPVVVSNAVVAARVTLAGELTLRALDQMLRVVGASVVDRGGVLRFDASGGGGGDRSMFAPVEVRLLPAPRGMSPRALAALFCERFASGRGRAIVVGDQVLVEDQAGGENRLEAFVRAWEEGRSEAAARGAQAQPSVVRPR